MRCVCVCVCFFFFKEKERDTERKRERERERWDEAATQFLIPKARNFMHHILGLSRGWQHSG